MLKDFLKGAMKGLLQGSKKEGEEGAKRLKTGLSEGFKNAVKSFLKKPAKEVLKKGGFALLRIIMIPWGIILIIFLICTIGIVGYFTGTQQETQSIISKSQEQLIMQDVNKNIDTNIPHDYLGLTGECLASPQIIENYIRFLILDKRVNLPLTNSEINKLVAQALKDLKPQFTFENGQVTTTTYTTKNGKTTKSVSVQNVKLLKSSISVYGDYTYTYSIEHYTSNYNKNVKVVTSYPALANKTMNKKNEYELLTNLLTKEGVSKGDLQVAIGAILFSKQGDTNSWNWLMGNKLPAPPISTMGGFGGGLLGGSVGGLPPQAQAWETYYQEAQKATGVPDWLLVADTNAESSFNPNAVSCTGAYGLLQFEESNWDYDLSQGMGQYLSHAGFTGGPQQLWNEFVKSPKMQIFVGAWEWRWYLNYYLIHSGLVSNNNYESTANMSKIDWNAPVGNSQLERAIKETAFIYNCGQAYFDCGHYNAYADKVYRLAMEYRSKTTASSIGVNGINGLPANQQAIIEKVISVAESCIGNSTYVLGGGRTLQQEQEHIFDCSSFVWYCYDQAGIQLGPLSSVTTWTLVQAYPRVPLSQMRPGDLIFFNVEGPNSHVGIYLGNGKFISAEDPALGVGIASINSPYWAPKVSEAVRPY